jgi:pimeloyl-ACP methyl ester carboxylesterase
VDANQSALVVDGCTLECLWFGPSPAHNPTLIFLHEGLGSATMWRDFPQQLADATGCGALVYSRAGYGASDPVALPRPIRYMHDEAAVLAEVIEHAGVRDAILIGHSDGASIALIYAGGARSGRLRALVLEAPHVFAEPSGLASIAAMKQQYETTDLRDRLGRYHKNVDMAFRGWNDVWLHPDFRRWNIEEFLPSIDVPMLLMQGAGDEYGTWKQVDAIVQKVGGPVQTQLVPDCGHSPHRDQPEITLAAMTDFITAVRP